MTSASLAIQGAAIVLRGEFNPAIVSPGWLAAQGLIGQSEAAVVREQVILNRFSTFHVSWLSCQVTDDQLQVSTDEPPEFERLRDLAVGILKVLPHTPVSLLGLNRHFHFQMPSYEDWHRIGDQLVSKDFWSGVLTLPGTANVEVQGVRPDLYGGYIKLTVQPSKLVKAGVYVGFNDHYVLETVERQPVSREEFLEVSLPGAVPPSSERVPIALKILQDEWIKSIDLAERTAFLLARLGDVNARSSI